MAGAPSAPTMSTPIQHLPAQGGSAGEMPSDPEVLAVLSEMESEVNSARAAHAASMMPPPVQHLPTRVVMPHGSGGVGVGMGDRSCYYDGAGGMRCGMSGAFNGGIWNQTYAQYALIAAAAALVLFYPASLEAVYQKIPVARVAELFAANDKFVRAAMFALVVYVVLMKLQL